MAQFEAELSVGREQVEGLRFGHEAIAWSDFLLNPRRLRGSDFLMRWSQGAWSEHTFEEAIDATGCYIAMPYGPSGVAPSSNPREFELYFERLERAGLGRLKRPDLLVLRAADQAAAAAVVNRAGGAGELSFIAEDQLRPLLDLALIAVECENSLWKAERMPAFGKDLRPQRALGGALGAPKAAVLPTIILKEEDREPLRAWQRGTRVPVHIWHTFYDRAYGIAFTESERLIADGRVPPTRQTFQAPGGPTTAKTIYKIWYQLGYEIGARTSEPRLVADAIEDTNGHILPYVRFEGGGLRLGEAAVAVLRAAEETR